MRKFILSYRFFSGRVSKSHLYFCSSTPDLLILPKSVLSDEISLRLDTAVRATKTELDDFIKGISQTKPWPVNIFFLTHKK